MKEMLRAFIIVFAAAAIFGQTQPAKSQEAQAPPPASPQVPPEVDAALRARISQFYQLQMEEKYNQALQLVAEDTKDLFVGSSKAPPRSFEIQSIRYSDDFTKADVIVAITRMLTLEGFMGRPLLVKIPSRWKLENGQWCYYVDPQRDMATSPFRHGAPPNMPATATGAPPGAPPGAPSPLAATAPAIPPRRPLTVDKLNVKFKSAGPSADQVVISNPSPWPVALALTDPKVAGLTVKLDPAAITAGQQSIVKIRWSGDAEIPKAPVMVKVTVAQTNQIIPIKVSFIN
jgi:hypothetical protein